MKDLGGQRFGRLSVLRPTDARKNGEVLWECLCDCGNTVVVAGSRLKRGDTRSCGCLRKEETEKRASLIRLDLTGQRFGRLTALRSTAMRKKGSVVWECACDCGNTVFAAANKLTGNNVQSCGCLQRDRIRHTGKQRATDITGQKFGLLKAIRPTEKREYGGIVWECICDCGCTTFAAPYVLRNGGKKSCGCLRNKSKPNQNKPSF